MKFISIFLEVELRIRPLNSNQITNLLINCKIQLQKHKANLIQKLQTTNNGSIHGIRYEPSFRAENQPDCARPELPACTQKHCPG